jgi:WD40 repeat protein
MKRLIAVFCLGITCITGAGFSVPMVSSETFSDFGTIADAAWSPDGQTLAIMSQSEVGFKLFDADLQIISERPGDLSPLTWNPSGDRLAVAAGAGISIYDVPALDEQSFTAVNLGNSHPIAWNPDVNRNTIAVGRFNSIVMFDAVTMQEMYSFALHQPNRRVISISWHPDGIHLLSASDNGTVKIWNTDTNEVNTLEHPEGVWEAIWNPYYMQIAAIIFGKLYIWDAVSLQNVAIIETVALPVEMAWGEVGLAIVLSNDMVQIWDISTQTVIASI